MRTPLLLTPNSPIEGLHMPHTLFLKKTRCERVLDTRTCYFLPLRGRRRFYPLFRFGGIPSASALNDGLARYQNATRDCRSSPCASDGTLGVRPIARKKSDSSSSCAHADSAPQENRRSQYKSMRAGAAGWGVAPTIELAPPSRRSAEC